MHESYNSTFIRKVAGVPCPTCKGAGSVGATTDARVVPKRRCKCDRCHAPSRRLEDERRVEGVLVAAEEAPAEWTRVASRTGAEPELHLCPACALELELGAGVVTAEAYAIADDAYRARQEAAEAAELAKQELEAQLAASADNLLAHKQALLEQGRIELNGLYTVQSLLQLIRDHLAERGI